MNKEMLFLQEWAEHYPHSATALVEALKVTPQGIAVYIPINRPSVNAAPPVQAPVEQGNISVAGKLLEFLEKEIPGNQFRQMEALMLACHASISTADFKRLVSSGS